MKKKLKIIGAVIILILVLIGAGSIYTHFKPEKEVEVPLETILQNSSDLTTQELLVSNVFKTTKGSIPLINKSKMLVQYRTTITAGFDVSEAEFDNTEDKLTITIPHCTINEDSIKIKSDDLHIYDTNFSLLNIDSDDLLEVISEAEKDAKELATASENGFLDAADANAAQVVKGLYQNVVDGKEVVVEFK